MISHNRVYALKNLLAAPTSSKSMGFVAKLEMELLNSPTIAWLVKLVAHNGNSNCRKMLHVYEGHILNSPMINNQFIYFKHNSIQKILTHEGMAVHHDCMCDRLFVQNNQQQYIQMSILSKQQFDKLCLTLQSTQEQLLQESKNIENKIILAQAKIDVISEQVDKENQTILHEGADRLLKIHQQMEIVRSNVSKFTHKYNQQMSNMKDQLNKQIEMLYLNINISKEARTKEIRNIEKKLSEQIRRIQEESIQQNERQIQQISTLQTQLIKQLGICEGEILSNRNKIKEDQSKLSQKVNKISQDLSLKVKSLGSLRKQKRAYFLQLLQKVVIKIREAETFQI